LEKTMEADISIWQKPGHFYFALTRAGWIVRGELLYRTRPGPAAWPNAL